MPSTASLTLTYTVRHCIPQSLGFVHSSQSLPPWNPPFHSTPKRQSPIFSRINASDIIIAGLDIRVHLCEKKKKSYPAKRKQKVGKFRRLSWLVYGVLQVIESYRAKPNPERIIRQKSVSLPSLCLSPLRLTPLPYPWSYL
jgi:hypothetical protein